MSFLRRELVNNKETPPRGVVFLVGGLEGIRTLDPHNANVVRSQLRYKPVWDHICEPFGGHRCHIPNT